MNKFLRLFNNTSLNEIFTPNTVAKLTYVNRNVLETDLEKYLTMPGKQIVIYGHSGSGKTTLLLNKLKKVKLNFIKTHCESKTTFNDLLLQAFDELNKFYVSEKSTNSQYTISDELKVEYSGISAKLGDTQSESNGEKFVRIVPIQLTPQKLAQFLGEINGLWIIEDFHKVKDDEKLRIADVIKIFIDSANEFANVKIICIGAVGTARELIELDNNLNNRVAELFVPLLNNEEIEEIVNKGFDLLNVTIDKDLKEKIIYYSNNLASITHQICYDLCYHSDIKIVRFFPKKLRLDSFKVAVSSYVRKNSDTFSKIYDTIVCHRYGWNVLNTFEGLEKEYLTFGEIKSNIPPTKGSINESELISYLEQLGSSEYKEIIRYDKSSQKYSLSSPFFRAFLKMKFALEKSEQKDILTKKKNKQINKYSIDNIKGTRIVLDDEFFITYNEVLESLQASNLRFRTETKKIKRKR